MPDGENQAAPDPSPGPNPETPDPGATPDALTPERAAELRRLAYETKNERQVWIFLGYFLFVIHIIAFVMIYAVRHAK
ncbi:hypothetical protein IAG44_16915 [Streptomyces roseirectus]|uniref:Uncharacterized protein n=1 Tax=Streptomyces roseirectus TaxID=2768066 RepID=A0A7H0ITW3_9ACTN|nr:hypothetical protein [Streptomyces roseirectus]QNP76229.1 hypothetical protein IAG44_16915 [Streptomyces roseirectus]